jgi:hypothetical protein
MSLEKQQRILNDMKKIQADFKKISDMTEPLRVSKALQELVRGFNQTKFDSIFQNSNLITQLNYINDKFTANLKGSNLQSLLDTMRIINDSIKWEEISNIQIKNSPSFKTLFPHASLYDDIFTSIDQDLLEDISNKPDVDILIPDDTGELELEEDIEIKNPLFYNAAVTIHLHIHMTDAKVQESGNDEEKTLWNTHIKKVLTFLQVLFLTWAFSDVQLKDMMIFKTFEHVANIVAEYNNSETTDVVTIESEDKL